MPDLHHVHAVCQHPTGEHAIFRIGRAVSWGRAQDRFNRFDDPTWRGLQTAFIAGMRVRHFNVRSVDDPDPRWTGAIPIRARDVVMTDNPAFPSLVRS